MFQVGSIDSQYRHGILREREMKFHTLCPVGQVWVVSYRTRLADLVGYGDLLCLLAGRRGHHLGWGRRERVEGAAGGMYIWGTAATCGERERESYQLSERIQTLYY